MFLLLLFNLQLCNLEPISFEFHTRPLFNYQFWQFVPLIGYLSEFTCRSFFLFSAFAVLAVEMPATKLKLLHGLGNFLSKDKIAICLSLLLEKRDWTCLTLVNSYALAFLFNDGAPRIRATDLE